MRPSDFDGLAITGRVALIQRGTCASGSRSTTPPPPAPPAVVLFNEGQEGRRGRDQRHPGRPERRDPDGRHELRARQRPRQRGREWAHRDPRAHPDHDPFRGPDGRERDRPDPHRRSEQRRDGRRAPGQRVRRTRDQRQRLRLGDPARAGQADLEPEHPPRPAAAVCLVGCRGGGPGRLRRVLSNA